MMPAIVPATVEIRMSLFLICANSWAMTPFSSFSFRIFMMPSVTATTACSGFLPVAKAFGEFVGIMYTFGIGKPAF